MEYIVDINNWTNLFIEQICKKDNYTIEEVSELKDLYINLRTRYKKETIDKLTVEFLSNNDEVIDFFKSKEITRKEINDLFDFYNKSNEILNSKELQNTVTSSMESGDISEIKDFKIKTMYETGLLDFLEFKKYFKHDVAFCEVKEALGWYIAYIESGDYDINSIIVKDENNQIDRKKTFFNIMEDINNKSLTNVPPFRIDNENVKFMAAGSSEVDVMMWNESEQKIIGMSATRDRTTQIEGNQFIRHNMLLNAWSTVFDDYKINKRIPEQFKLSTKDIKNVMHDYGWQSKLNTKNVLKIKDLDSDVLSSIEEHNFAFARHLSVVRESIKKKTGISYHENGTYITDKEIENINNHFKDKVKFYFFGEVYNKSQLPELNAGLVKRAYTGNFDNIMNFSMDKKASRLFMNNLSIRYNDVPLKNSIDLYAQKAMYSLLSNTKEEFKPFAQFFSEGSVYKEERSMLYRSVSLFLEEVNHTKDFSKIEDIIKENFDKLSEKEISTINDKLQNLELFKNIEDNIKLIRKAPSEVNPCLDNLKAQAIACENKIRLQHERSKNDNLLEYLKSQGINVDMDALNEFRKKKDEAKDMQCRNKGKIDLN